MRRVLVVLLALGWMLGACAEEVTPEAPTPTEPELITPQEGKADSVGDRRLDLSFWGAEAWLPSQTYEGYAIVEAEDDDSVQVFTERIAFRPNTGSDLISIEVDPLGIVRSLRDEMQFTLFFRTSGQTRWRQIAIREPSREFDKFSRVDIDLGAQTFAFLTQDDETEKRIEGKLATGGLFDAQTELAIGVFPYATWFSLRGDYSYRAHVSCDGRTCEGHKTPTTHPALHQLMAGDQFPESGDHDPFTDALFVTSLTDASVLKIDNKGEQTLFAEGETPFGGLGVRVEVFERRLWVCAVRTDQGQDYPGEVWVFDIDEEKRLHRFDLGRAFDKGSCNDMVLHTPGVAFVTDRENPNVYRLDLNTDTVEIFAQDEDLLDSSGVGTNGIALTPEGTHLVITNYLPSRLMVVALDNPDKVTKVDLEGDAFHEVLGGADGIRFVDNTLFVTFPSKLARVVPRDPSWQQARVRMTRLPTGGMSGLILVERDLYLTNGQVATWLLGRDPDPFVIERFDWTTLDP